MSEITEDVAPDELMRTAFDAANKHDLTESYWLDEKSVYHFIGIGVFRGRAQIIDYFNGMFAAMPDFQLEIERTIREGITASVVWNATGTFRGSSLMGVAPTGKRLVFRGVDVVELEGGIVRSNTVYMDSMSFARQVGMLPPDGSSADKALKSSFNLLTGLRRAVRR